MKKLTLLILCSMAFYSSYCQGKTIPQTLTEIECGLNALHAKAREMGPLTCPSQGQCDDPNVRDSYLMTIADDPIVIKTRVRVFRETDGSNPAATAREVAMQMHYLNKEFAPFGFQFTYAMDFVDNSNFRNITTTDEVIQAFQAFSVDKGDYCNILVTSAPFSAGFPPWFSLGNAGLIMNRGVQFYPGNNRSSLTHEMGHVLGLQHTFYGYSEIPCTHPCAENTSTVNLDLAGDLCSDTPPQELSFSHGFTPTLDNCSNNTPFDSISHTNFESYSDCKSTFTPQQVARMRCWALNHLYRIGWIDDSDPEIPYVFEDDYGYTYSDESSISELNWLDITEKGEELAGLADDNVIGPFSIGFDFNFYGQSFNEIYVGSNGYLSFSPFVLSTLAGPFPSIPVLDGNDGFIAPFLADLRFSGAGGQGKVYFYSNQNDSLIITFERAPFFNQATGTQGSNTFQAILSAADTSIVFQYLDMDDYYPPSYTATAKPSIVGIESPDGTDGLEVNNFQIPVDSSRIKLFLKVDSLSSAVAPRPLKGRISIFPNPSNDRFMISVSYPKLQKPSLEILSAEGRRLKTLAPASYDQHEAAFYWDAKDSVGSRLPSGLYFARILIGKVIVVKKLILL